MLLGSSLPSFLAYRRPPHRQKPEWEPGELANITVFLETIL